jgi:hypothetical protein
MIPEKRESGDTTLKNGGLFLKPVFYFIDERVLDKNQEFDWVFHKRHIKRFL